MSRQSDDPVVSPTDQRLGTAGDERVVVHAGAVEGEAAFATQGIIDGPEQGAAQGEDADTSLARCRDRASRSQAA